MVAEPVLGATATVVLSALAFSGAGQFALVGVLLAGGGPLVAIGTGLLVSARFVAMGLALAPSLPRSRVRRIGYAASIVDSSWAMAHDGHGRFDLPLMAAATALQYVAWVAGTLLGVLVTGIVDTRALGLDSVLPAFYLAVLLPELRTASARGVALLGAGTSLALLPVAPPGVAVLVGGSVCLLGLIHK